MKRKFLSTLLFGALACTTLSTVTSCKDYDDDISANAQEISSLKTTVSNLQTALDQAKADATAALANYATKTELGNVSNSVAALQDAVAKLVTADQLQKALDEAKAALETKASQEDLDKVSQTVAAINADLDAIKTWQKTTDSAIETANKNIEAQKEALEELKKALEGKSSTEDLNALAKVVEGKADATALADLEKKVKAIEEAGYDLDELAKTFAKVSDLADLKKAMNDADTELTNKIGAQANILSVLVNKRLSSLVFKPAYMLDGVEADVLPALVKPYIYVFKSDKLGTKDEAIDDEKSGNQEALSIYPEYNIYYHFNPASSDLTGYAVSFFNNEPTKVTTTRAEGVNTNLKPAVSEIDNTYKTTTLGVVKIPVANSKETWKAMEDVYKAGKLPMVALQAAKGDTIITSDYAQIVPVNYKNLVLVDNEKATGLADCSMEGDFHHLNQNIARVIGWNNYSYYCHEVMYNDHNIDLTKFIDTHVNLGSVDNKSWNETEVTDSMLNVLGLSYKFHAISYTLNGGTVNEKTDQSIHLKVEENGKASVMEVDENGKVVGPNEKKGAVGRLPIVRVTLEDAAGNIYAYGYIKVKIVEEIATPQDVDVTFTETVNANCADNSISLTWAQAESKILNALNISHDTFLNRYWNWGDWEYAQYVKNADGTFSTVKENNNKIIAAILKAQTEHSTTLTSAEAMLAEFYAQGGVGYIEATAPAVSNGKTVSAGNFQNATNAWGSAELPQNYNGANTSIATWTFTAKDYSTLAKLNGFVDPATGKSLKPVKTYIRLGNSDAEGGTLYVGLNLPVGGMQFAAGTLGVHLNNKWYATASNAEGNDEIHANVAVPTTNPATGKVETFTYDILTTFKGGKVAVDYATGIKAENFTAFNNYAANYKFVFNPAKYNIMNGAAQQSEIKDIKSYATGASKTVYAIVAVKDNDGAKQLYAVEPTVENKTTKYIWSVQKAHQVASLLGSTIVYQTDEKVAQDILNYSGHEDLAKTFGAYIKMVNNADVCYDPFINGSDEFVVRFLRPINAAQGEGASAIDAVDGGSNINVNDMIKLDDWRDYGITYADKLAQSGKMHTDYINYYGITVTFDPAGARTDEDLADAERVELTNVEAIEKLGKIEDVDPNIALTPNSSFTFTPQWIEETYKEDEKTIDVPAHWGATVNGANILNYKNNTTTARKFHIYLPITVKYVFGDKAPIATFYGVITVNKTEQNAKKH